MLHGGLIQAATRRPRGCLSRSLLSLLRYAALRGRHAALMVRGTQERAPVARRKRSAPAKHSARSADDGTEV
ncbi:hypothetical protein GCM10011382_33060 [Vreelandella lutescens]|uniref:Uncharacterized protein n=1 Tax=Vreelandella lutescens TaxID=1602943 RepID=A0ABQ1PMR6_9GAMM|nr:hypothetical protein GCM10011382_33060 [Halomonas lutescens]